MLVQTSKEEVVLENQIKEINNEAKRLFTPETFAQHAKLKRKQHALLQELVSLRKSFESEAKNSTTYSFSLSLPHAFNVLASRLKFLK